MSSEKMFSKFLQYFFMFNGLPVFCSHQNKACFIVWYLWRVSIVLRYNVDLILSIHYMRVRWIYPYSIFGFIDVAVTAFVVDSLIGKHRRLIDLQKAITDDLVKKNYSILPEDRFRMKALQAFFGIVFSFSAITLIHGLYRFSNLNLKEFSAYTWFYVFLISVTGWITTVSSTLFYCIFCKHLMSMFKSINLEIKKLGNLSTEMPTKVATLEFYQGNLKRNRIQSMTEDSSIFPTPMTFWSEDCLKNTITLSLPLVSKPGKKTDNQKGVISTSNVDSDRRFSCSILGSSKLARHPSQVPCLTRFDKSSKEDIKGSNSLARKIQKLNRKFASVSLLVQEADNLFSLQVLTILTITFLRTCSYIYIYLSSDWPKHDCCATMSITQQIFFDFLAFGSVAMEASLVTEEAQKFSPLISKVEEIYRSKSVKVQVQADVAQLTVYSFDVQLTAWKFFTVSRSFMPTVIGVTATYILIIFQLHQIVQEKQCNMWKNGTDIHFLNGTTDLL